MIRARHGLGLVVASAMCLPIRPRGNCHAQSGCRARDGPGTPRVPALSAAHSQVRPRQLTGQTRYAAVYPDLAAGRYTIWREQDTPAAAVTVAGGQVTSCHWPG